MHSTNALAIHDPNPVWAPDEKLALHCRAFAELTGGVVLAVSAGGRICASAGSAANEVSAILTVSGSLLDAVVHEERVTFQRRWREGVASGAPFSLELGVLSQVDGSPRRCVLRAAPVSADLPPSSLWVVLIAQKVPPPRSDPELTDLVRVARRRVHDEALARVASGVAHNFNNLMHNIMVQAEVIAKRATQPSEVRKGVSAILELAYKGGEICKQLHSYAGGTRPSLKACSLATVISDLESELRARCGSHIRLLLETSARLAPVEVEPHLLREAILQLVTNAAEALEERRGTISLSVSARFFDESELRSFQVGNAAAAGLYQVIEVRDDGPGIPAELLPQVFEPFVSLRFHGRGLGLAAVAGCVRSMAGAARAICDAQGTCVQLLVPSPAPGLATAGVRSTPTGSLV